MANNIQVPCPFASLLPALTFHMIKIPSSTNKVRKRGRDGEVRRRTGSYLEPSLSPRQDAGKAARSNLRSLRGCEYVSGTVSSPLPTRFLLCLGKPSYPDPAERERERNGTNQCTAPSLSPTFYPPFLFIPSSLFHCF